jgi:hypothetical protein
VWPGWHLQSELVAIIVPDMEEISVWAEGQGLGGMSFQELCRQPLLRSGHG